jgi:hypothetical protein
MGSSEPIFVLVASGFVIAISGFLVIPAFALAGRALLFS